MDKDRTKPQEALIVVAIDSTVAETLAHRAVQEDADGRHYMTFLCVRR